MIKSSAIVLSALFLPASLAAQSSDSSAQQGANSAGDGLSLTLPDTVSADDLGQRDAKIVAIQVLLDRSRHSPGVIDGQMGGNTRRAIRYYRQANDLPKGDGVDDALIKSLLETQGSDVFGSYTITEEDVAGPFSDIPADFAKKAELDRLGYTSVREMLAERFHMDEDFLAALNPDLDFTKAGQKIAIVSHGDERMSGEIARIEVRKGEGTVAALDGDGKVLASYPATIGSNDFPSPNGQMKVNAIASEPTYYFDPSDQEWGPDERLEIPAGPNNPVGGTWIDLGKEGYGIHGSPDPQKVSKRASHGCVRLTNWDAEELARAVKTGTPVSFV